jgi:hypothetical protein
MMCLKAFGIAYPLAGTTPTANSIKVRYFQIFFVRLHRKIIFSFGYATDLPIVQYSIRCFDILYYIILYHSGK